MSLIKQVAVSDLRPHPDNRMITGVDSERVARIVKYIQDDGLRFSPEYPLTVRPIENGCYQIISGHHRFEAAKQLGLPDLPCVVREFNDIDALIRMVTSNDQRDNNPLDIGGAAKAACEKYTRGMSYADFAAKIGYAKQTLADLVSASEVVYYLSGQEVSGQPDNLQPDKLKAKATHLTEISRAPKQSWQQLVDLLADKENTVSKIKNYVKLINQLVDAIPQFMLPDDSLAKDKYIESLCGIAIRSQAEASKRAAVFAEISRLGESLGKVESVNYIDTGEIVDRDGFPYHVLKAEKITIDLLESFVHAIKALPTTPDISRVQAIYKDVTTSYRKDDGAEVIYQSVLTDEELAAKKAQDEIDRINAIKLHVGNKIVNGDCVEALSSWQGKRIKLLLTDPPYGMNFQSNRRTASNKSKKIDNDESIESALDVFGSVLDAVAPHFEVDAHLVVFCNDDYEPDFRRLIESKGFQFKRLLVWVKPNHGTGDLTGSFAPQKELMIHAVKGRPLVEPRIPDVFIQESKEIETDHPTEKPKSVLKKIILSTTTEGDMVIDPFAGTGSGLVSALELNRDCWGAELEDAYFVKAQERMIGTVK